MNIYGVIEYFYNVLSNLTASPFQQDFIKAKLNFIDEMIHFGEISPAKKGTLKVLDVGCGIGGSSR